MNKADLVSLRKAMRDPDHFACRIVYIDSKRDRTRRAISPIRFSSEDGSRLLALCLCREEPREFLVRKILSVELVKSEDLLMPERIEVCKSHEREFK